jgi:hypothetical protein
VPASSGSPATRRGARAGRASRSTPAFASAAVREAIEHADVRRLFELNFELTPFYCPRCDASYCSDHWDWWDVWDDDLPSWRDSVRGRCPHGHERMLED